MSHLPIRERSIFPLGQSGIKTRMKYLVERAICRPGGEQELLRIITELEEFLTPPDNAA